MPATVGTIVARAITTLAVVHAGPADGRMTSEHPQVPFLARTIRKLSPFIILAWVALTADRDPGSSLAGAGRPRAFRAAEPQDAPAVQAMARMGKVFKESDSDSFAMIVLEAQQRLSATMPRPTTTD